MLSALRKYYVFVFLVCQRHSILQLRLLSDTNTQMRPYYSHIGSGETVLLLYISCKIWSSVSVKSYHNEYIWVLLCYWLFVSPQICSIKGLLIRMWCIVIRSMLQMYECLTSIWSTFENNRIPRTDFLRFTGRCLKRPVLSLIRTATLTLCIGL